MSFAPLIAQIVFENFIKTRKPVAVKKNAKAELALMALAGFFAVAGAVMLVYALYAAMAAYYPPPIAALISGIALYILALLSIMTGKMLVKSRRVETIELPEVTVEDQIQSVMKTVEAVLGNFKREVDAPVQENPAVSLLVASVAGFLAARHLR